MGQICLLSQLVLIGMFVSEGSPAIEVGLGKSTEVEDDTDCAKEARAEETAAEDVAACLGFKS
jgi:hypothetical protein